MLSATTLLLTSPKLTPKTMPPEAHRGSIASAKLRKKNWTTSVGGKSDLYYTSKRYLTLRRSSEEPRNLPREEKSTSPYLLFIYYKLQNGK
jgi:hypothetical protein